MKKDAGGRLKQTNEETTHKTHNKTKEVKGGRTIVTGKNLYADHVIRQMPLKVK